MIFPGVGIMLRKLGSTAKPTVEFSVNGDEWTFKTISTLKTTEVKFKLGEEVTETTLDGRECKVGVEGRRRRGGWQRASTDATYQTNR